MPPFPPSIRDGTLPKVLRDWLTANGYFFDYTAGSVTGGSDEQSSGPRGFGRSAVTCVRCQVPSLSSAFKVPALVGFFAPNLARIGSRCDRILVSPDP